MTWRIGSAQVYTVQSGDISGGNVILTIVARTTAARTIQASSSAPFRFWAVNIGH